MDKKCVAVDINLEICGVPELNLHL